MLTPKLASKTIESIEISTVYAPPAAAWNFINWILKRPTAEGGLKKFSIKDIQEPKEDSKAPEYPYLETKAEFDAAIEASKDRPLLIDFTAEWCPPCKYIGPIFDDYIE